MLLLVVSGNSHGGRQAVRVVAVRVVIVTLSGTLIMPSMVLETCSTDQTVGKSTPTGASKGQKLLAEDPFPEKAPDERKVATPTPASQARPSSQNGPDGAQRRSDHRESARLAARRPKVWEAVLCLSARPSSHKVPDGARRGRWQV